MKVIAPTAGMFLAILLTFIGLAKIYETIVQTFVPTYGSVFDRYATDLHIGLLFLAIGLTVIWRLRR